MDSLLSIFNLHPWTVEHNPTGCFNGFGVISNLRNKTRFNSVKLFVYLVTIPTMHSFCQVGCYLSRSQTHRQSDSERRLTFVRPTDRPKVFWSISWPETASTRLLRHKHTELINFLIMLFDQWLLWSDYDQNFKWVTTGPFKVIWPLVGKANFSEAKQSWWRYRNDYVRKIAGPENVEGSV